MAEENVDHFDIGSENEILNMVDESEDNDKTVRATQHFVKHREGDAPENMKQARGNVFDALHSPKNRMLLYIGLLIICVVIGVIAPLSRALTDEHSILNSNHGTMQWNKEGVHADPLDSLPENSASDSTSNSANSVALSSGMANADYILPEIADRIYDSDKLEALSNYELYLARNEVFAKYGRKFKNDDLNQYFATKSWYMPIYEPDAFDRMPSPLNDIERANIASIRQIEANRNSPYAA